ncbi:MAG: DUF4249 domain-containing protein [Bacteroidia bacterium]|nr:DUF4249 domain-containing protein [Bacteroidia bacterium]|tara:strand:- start:5530 stop:6339 length:810 start_codon:yes stop_codon:yes gene_type:complete
MKKIAILLSLISVFGCQSIVENVPLPKTEIKAVTFGYFDNLNLANKQNISLTKSKPVFNTANSQNSDYEPIQDAQITITGNGDNYEFYYEALDEEYEPIQAVNLQSGSEYTLTVNSPEFGVLKSTQIMPQPIGAYTVRTDSTVKEFEIDYRVSIELESPTNQYYRIEVFSASIASDPEGIYVDKEYFKFSESENRLTTTFSDWNSKGSGVDRSVYLVLSSITEDYYNYGRLLKNYDPQNPFGEPTLLPTNIDGGLGMFTLSSGVVIPIK